MLLGFVVLGGVLMTAQSALATPAASATATANQDGTITVTINNQSTSGESLNGVHGVLKTGSPTVTNVTSSPPCPWSPGKDEGQPANVFDGAPGLAAGSTMTVTITTDPSGYTGKIDLSFAFSGGGTIQVNDVQVQSGGSAGGGGGSTGGGGGSTGGNGAQCPDLSIRKTPLGDPGDIPAELERLGFTGVTAVDSDRRPYLLRVFNNSECGAHNVVVTDALQSGYIVPQGKVTVFDYSGTALPPELAPVNVRARDDGGATVTVQMDVPPHREIDVKIQGHAFRAGVYVNQAAIVSPIEVKSNVTIDIATPAPEITKVVAAQLALFGDADDGTTRPPHHPKAAASPLKALERLGHVDVAVRSIRKGGRCWWLAANGKFKRAPRAAAATCDTPAWLKAKGTAHWTYRFKRRLAKGRYELRVRAVNDAGVYDTTFKASHHNDKLFTVR